MSLTHATVCPTVTRDQPVHCPVPTSVTDTAIPSASAAPGSRDESSHALRSATPSPPVFAMTLEVGKVGLVVGARAADTVGLELGVTARGVRLGGEVVAVALVGPGGGARRLPATPKATTAPTPTSPVPVPALRCPATADGNAKKAAGQAMRPKPE